MTITLLWYLERVIPVRPGASWRVLRCWRPGDLNSNPSTPTVVLGTWPRHLSSLNLSFLTCKIGTRPTSHDCEVTEEVLDTEVLSLRHPLTARRNVIIISYSWNRFCVPGNSCRYFVQTTLRVKYDQDPLVYLRGLVQLKELGGSGLELGSVSKTSS